MMFCFVFVSVDGTGIWFEIRFPVVGVGRVAYAARQVGPELVVGP